MRLLVLLFCLLAGSPFGLVAQHSGQGHCGFDIGVDLLEAQYPGFRKAAALTFQEAKRKHSGIVKRSGEVYTIPVVVHIVWNEPEENLTDELIESQIDVLNEDFLRLNPDTANLRPIFEDRAGNPMIQFELMGIERVETSSTFATTLAGLPDNVKQGDDGGSDAWDTESYLNIWVCRLEPLRILGISLGQILGYAYPPADLANWPEDASAPSPELDGVVIDYRVFGRNNPNVITIDGLPGPLEVQGRTATHEVGHYLGLRHIWGDGDPLGLSSSCDADDGIEDTPNTGNQASFDCDLSRNTCQDGQDDLPDMIENYMDYSSESCLNTFTKGQVEILRAVLEGPRCGLINDCLSTSTQELKKGQSLSVFPNPTQQYLRLQLSDAMLEAFDLKIYSLLGQEQLCRRIGQNIWVDHLPVGMYTIVASNGNEKYTTTFVRQ
ncbi:MAG: M43 family zinc metalloprotease [Bacteroidota bacterium]